MREELLHDYEEHSKLHQDKPIFHRIKFDETSIYLTKASYYDLATGCGSQGHYRVFPWTDIRAKAFLGFELGQLSPALGKAQLIGSYLPNADDLTEVKYSSFEGKAYYESAKQELSKSEADAPSDKEIHTSGQKKIDASNFMAMREIIPTGAQGKAIYGTGNYIIDGAAGTGKSTTVLQKIKLLQLHEKISSDRICIIVKNKQVVEPFQKLLESLQVYDIKIYTQTEFVKSFYADAESLTLDTLIDAYHKVNGYVEEYRRITDIEELTSVSLTDEKKSAQLAGSQKFSSQLQLIIRSCEEFCLVRKKLMQAQDALKKEDREQLARYQKKAESELLAQKRKSLLRRLGFQSEEVKLNLGDEAKVRNIVQKYKTSLEQKQRENAKVNEQKLSYMREKINQIKVVLDKLLVSEDNLKAAFGSVIPTALLSRYANKHVTHLNSFHTVIIDEAQDVSQLAIELIRLQANNTILAGDESQQELEQGVGSWSSVLFVDNEFSENGKQNLFKLRHNFRQTYELGTVSYNYRQLILGRAIEDIKQDYFDDQIGYSQPSLKRIYSTEDFYSLVSEKLSYIQNHFTERFPLVVFYENSASLKRFQDLLSARYSIGLGNVSDKSKDILLISTDEIAGREFPVVIAPLTNNTLSSTTYIMLSRAKFDLTLALSTQNEIEPHIQKLIDAGLISVKQNESLML